MKTKITGTRLYYQFIGKLNQLVNHIERKSERTRLLSRPVIVNLVLTKACNFACVYCKNYKTSSGAQTVSLENFKKAARQLFPYAMELDICSGGEPYLHRDLEEFLRIARYYGLNTWLLSNGSVLKENRVRSMVRENLVTRHGFSIDGYKSETVASIRLNADLHSIIRNIEMLQRIKREERSTHPEINICYVLMRPTIEELPLAVERWGEMGIDRVNCVYLSLSNNMDPDLSLYYHQELLEKYFEKALEVAAQYPDMILSLPPIVREEKQRKTPIECPAPRAFVMIDTNGDVMPCYQAFEALRLGNLYEEHPKTFSQIWNSKPYCELRRTVNNDNVEKFFPYCSMCESRFGYGLEGAHRSEESWLAALGPEWLPKDFDHRRPTHVPRPPS